MTEFNKIEGRLKDLQTSVDNKVSRVKSLVKQLKAEEQRELLERTERRLLESRVRRLKKQKDLQDKIRSGLAEIEASKKYIKQLQQQKVRNKFLQEAMQRRIQEARDLEDELLVLALAE